MQTVDETTHEFEVAATAAGAETFALTLYVAGASPRSMRAIERARSICERYLHGRHRLDVVDLYESPKLAKQAGIFGAPTLVKESPAPVRKLIGDMRDERRLLLSLGLDPDSCAGSA